MATSINDLRIGFWGGVDAEHATLQAAYDAGVNAADLVAMLTGTGSDIGVTLVNRAAPDAPAATKVILYARDTGGKVELVARFPTGAVQQVAIEP